MFLQFHIRQLYIVLVRFYLYDVCIKFIVLFVLSHEYISGYYRLSVYFLSKVLSDILMLRTIPAVVFTCVAYFMIGEYFPNSNQ